MPQLYPGAASTTPASFGTCASGRGNEEGPRPTTAHAAVSRLYLPRGGGGRSPGRAQFFRREASLFLAPARCSVRFARREVRGPRVRSRRGLLGGQRSDPPRKRSTAEATRREDEQRRSNKVFEGEPELSEALVGNATSAFVSNNKTSRGQAMADRCVDSRRQRPEERAAEVAQSEERAAPTGQPWPMHERTVNGAFSGG